MKENTTLSPKTQAVLDAFRAVPDLRDGPSIAGALRAAVKACAFEDFNTRLLTAADLLAIAAELEAL